MDINTNLGSVQDRSFFAGTELAPLSTSVKLKAGQGVLNRGAVIGKVTADGEYKLVDAAASDGSEVASMVLAETIDTTGAAVNAVSYTQGIFHADALYVAEGDTVEAHLEELRAGNIYIKTEY